MGLIRIAIVVGVGVALLPSDREQQKRLMQRAGDATTWAMTYCDRNPATCVQAGGLWQQFTAKAEFGAKLAYDMMLQRAMAKPDVAAGDPGARNTDVVRFDNRGGTLTPNDRRPAWRADAKPRGSI